MQTLHHGQVEPADIDDLGHMNVRVYAHHAAAGARALMAALGLDAHALGAIPAHLAQPDCHTLFRREQLLGAPLGVRGGVLQVAQACLYAYLELYNRDTEEVAATFRKELALRNPADLSPIALPALVRERAPSLHVEWPAHGKPRSLPLQPVRDDLTTADMATHGLAPRYHGYPVSAAMSTPEGFMDLSGAPWLAYGQEPVTRDTADHSEAESWFSESGISIATLESRHTLVAVPRTGDVIVTYTANTEVRRKIVRFRHWSFAEASGRLLAVLDEVGIGLNLETRRSCEFPPAMRAQLAAQNHPELV